MSLYFDGTGGIELGGLSLPLPANSILTYPFSISAWFFPTDSVNSQYLVQLYDGNVSAWSLAIDASATRDPVQARNEGAGTTYNSSRFLDSNYNLWHVATANFFSAGSNQLFMDQGAGDNTFNNGNATQGDPIITKIGFGKSILSGGNFFKGYLAHVCIHNVRLRTNSYFGSGLSTGTSPLKILPNNLVAYWPFTEPGAQINLASAKSRTTYPFWAENTGVRYSNWNPPVKTVLPTARIYRLPSSIVSGNNVPVLYHQRQQQGMAS